MRPNIYTLVRVSSHEHEVKRAHCLFPRLCIACAYMHATVHLLMGTHTRILRAWINIQIMQLLFRLVNQDGEVVPFDVIVMIVIYEVIPQTDIFDGKQGHWKGVRIKHESRGLLKTDREEHLIGFVLIDNKAQYVQVK